MRSNVRVCEGKMREIKWKMTGKGRQMKDIEGKWGTLRGDERN